MKTNGILKHARRFTEPFRVTHGEKFRLKTYGATETLGFTGEDKPRAKEALDAAANLDLEDPKVGPDKLKELAAAKKALLKK